MLDRHHRCWPIVKGVEFPALSMPWRLRSEPEHNSWHYTHRVKRAPVDSAPQARVGRPRDPQIDAAVLDATLAVLDDPATGG